MRSDESVSGGGALPGQGLPTHVVEIPLSGAEGVARELRLGQPAVVLRVARGALVIDPRTVLEGQHDSLIHAVKRMLADSPLQR